MKIYWYAPFDNASETDLAIELTKATDHDLTVHSCSHRFGEPLDPQPSGRYTLIRDLPPPAGEMGERRTARRQFRVLLHRSARRKRVVEQGAFDVVHLHTFNFVTDWSAIKRLRRHATVVVQSVHDVRPQRNRLPHRLETLLLRRGYASCTGLIVAHQHLKHLLVSEFGIPEDRIDIVPLPVLPLPGLVRPGPRAHGDPLTVLFFGTFRDNKGIPVLLEAIELLASRTDLRFVFAGRGAAPLEDAVRNAAERDHRIRAEIGYITDDRRQELLEGADLVVLPYTRFNSQSGVLSGDSYGSGRPVIATRVGALGQAVEADKSGWLVEAGDSIGLARMIEHVIDAPDEYNERLRNVAEIAATRSMRQIAAKINDVYTHHAGDAGEPS